MSRFVGRAASALSLVGLAAACSSTESAGSASVGSVPAADLHATISDAPTVGALAGTVVDETDQPIANAAITVGTATTTTDANGVFTLTPPPGRGLLLASAPGKVSFARTVGVTSESPRPDGVRLTLVGLAAPQLVPATGGSVRAGVAMIDIPAGAFPSGISISATWIDRAHIAATSGRPLFVDDHGFHRLHAQLHVEVATEPAGPVTLRVPVPAGASRTTQLVLYRLQDGEHTDRIEPTRVADGFASFSVDHFSDYHVLEERAVAMATAEGDKLAASAWVLVSAAGGVIYDTVGKAFKVGDDLPPNTKLSGASFSAWAPNDAQVACGEEAITLLTDDDGTTGVACDACSVRAEVAKTPVGKTKFFVRTKAAVIGVRGTVFSLAQKPCALADGSMIDTVEVSEGNVNFTIGGEDFDVSGGKKVSGCEGCKDPFKAVCDCDVAACDRAGGQCLLCNVNETSSAFTATSLVKDAGGNLLLHCVPRGTVCCTASTGTYALCQPYAQGRAICQCPGKRLARCATTNSYCGFGGGPAANEFDSVDCGQAPGYSLCGAKAPDTGLACCGP